ncbi:MAG: GNAT family N-acetyltransferase [Chloroflexi bacterium]|nr:GNAT family N-acetyltransferase [Chloroflexota bacterium]
MISTNTNDKIRPQRNKPIINFAGEKVALGPLRQDLIPLHQKWNNDFNINLTARSLRPVTFEEEFEAYSRFSKEKRFAFFTIYEKARLHPIGFTYLSDISDQTAEFGIVIGEKEYHGQGFGTETTKLILDYAFTILGLHNVMLKAFEFNFAGIQAYKKAGFREMGRRREAKLINGKLWDMVYMDCLSTEFQSPILQALFEGTTRYIE